MSEQETTYEDLAETQEPADVLLQKKTRTNATIVIIYLDASGSQKYIEVTDGKVAAEKEIEQIGNENIVKIFRGVELKPQVRTTVKL